MNIPFIRRSLTPQGLISLLDYRNGQFSLPDEFYHLLPAVSAADNIGDEQFLAYIAKTLYVHPNKLTMACDVKKTLRDRYRLKGRVTLHPTPNDKCHACRDTFMETDKIDTTNCCGVRLHVMCMRRVTVCPHCGDGWVSLNCCVCNRVCNSYDAVDRMECCDADIHIRCLSSVYYKYCPVCGLKLNKNGYPASPNLQKSLCIIVACRDTLKALEMV